jgi:hypothetical protein
MDTMTIATVAEKKLHDLLDHPSQNIEDRFTLPNARLYGVQATDDGEVQITFLAQRADVYDLLSDKSVAGVNMFNFVGIVTSGWAAPLGANGKVEGRPSEHESRRRVRLMVVANSVEMASVIRFKDEPDEVVTDAGQATGALAEAIAEFLS